MLTNALDYHTNEPGSPWFDYAYRSQIGDRRIEDRTQTVKNWEGLAKYGKATIGNYIIEITHEF